MKALFYLIIIAAIGYLAWSYQQGTLPLPQVGVPEDSEGVPSRRSDPETSVAAAATPAPPIFKSRIRETMAVSDGDRKIAPAGHVYILERVSKETPSGVVAAVPGDQAKIVQRSGENLRVSVGGTDFDVKESQVTTDLDAAKAAERNDFARRNEVR